MVPNALDFIPAVHGLLGIGMVLQKPKSVGRPEADEISARYPTEVLDREWASNAERVIETFRKRGLLDQPVVISDIGGYFAESLDEINSRVPGAIKGVMEGTENGAVEYAKLKPGSAPVVTVARSRLKFPEDYLVASSVVFSIESILREVAQILQTRTACVIGYGRVGSAVADILRHRGISTVVHDTSPIAMAEAAARGFPVYRRVDVALATANLVVCATGDRDALALDAFALNSLSQGCVVASVTSSDTVVDSRALQVGFSAPFQVSDHITRFDGYHGRYFWLIADGNAVNFVHGAVVGPAIQLIEGEKLAALSGLANDEFENRDGFALLEVSDSKKELVAQVWNEHFIDD